MAKDKPANEILELVRAYCPGVEVEVIPPQEGKPGVTLHVNDVPLKSLQAFASEIGLVIPVIIEALGTSFTPEEMKSLTDKNASIKPLEQALKKPQVVSRVIPLILGRLGKLIDDCVTPNGVFLELPHHLAAPVVLAWVEVNLLAEGKLKTWAGAFSGMSSVVGDLLPSDSES